MCVDLTAEKTNLVYRGADQSWGGGGGGHIWMHRCVERLLRWGGVCRYPELEVSSSILPLISVHHIIKRRSAERRRVTLRPQTSSQSDPKHLQDVQSRVVGSDLPALIGRARGGGGLVDLKNKGTVHSHHKL